MQHKIISILILVSLIACNRNLHLHHRDRNAGSVSGTSFYKQAVSYRWQQRDSLFLEYFNQGNVPDFFFQFKPINISFKDSHGKLYKIIFYCSPDYAMIGTNEDWARVPITPMAAQVVADSLHCFLPTRKMVDLIYQKTKVKLEPVPMYAFRDSTVTMWQHHLIIEGQRKGKKGLISGIKKDIVICSDSSFKGKTDRVAIYGWHKLDGKPVQPLYTGHVNWYVDYSHGARMIYDKIRVNGKWLNYKELLNDPLLKAALTDETGSMRFNY